MTLHFHEPPQARRLGGLDAAIRGLQAALERLGHAVVVNPPRETIPGGDADVAHFHGLWEPAFPPLARAYRETSVPLVVSPHGMLEPWAWRQKKWKKLPYWHFVERRWVARASLVLATAESEARRLARFVPPSRIATLPLGLTGDARPDHAAARVSLGWTNDETVLLFLSRIHEKKGLDLLLAALTDVRVPRGTRLVIVGPEEQPHYAARCRAFAEENSARLPPIEWRGAVWGDERWRFLQGADLFCLPTHSENFGLVVLEACQVGTRVLTTTGTPWAEALAGRGFICEPERESIRAALARFFEAPGHGIEERMELSRWAWAHHDWDRLAPRYVALYESLATAPT